MTMDLENIKCTCKQLACRHKWRLIGLFQDIDEQRNIRYGVRRYHCPKCGKISHQDSRCDRIKAKNRQKRIKNI